MSTIIAGVALVQIWNAGLRCAACGSLEMQHPKFRQKITISAPSGNFVGLYLRNYGHVSTIGKTY